MVNLKSRTTFFVIFTIAVVLFYLAPLRELILTSFQNELYSHIILIPFISGYFLYSKRKELTLISAGYYVPGLALIAAGIALHFIGRIQAAGMNANDYLSIMTFAALVTLIGGVVFFCGKEIFRTALFPLLFLFLMIPVPQAIMDKLIYALQVGSTETSYAFFKIAGVPIIRDGFVFNLAGINVEVAKECSGIRSSLSLFIVGILSCDLFLSTWKGKTFLLLLLLPLAIFKNGLRIITLTLLALNVDESWLTNSRLHHEGGFVFFLAALLVFGAIIWLLRKWEARHV